LEKKMMHSDTTSLFDTFKFKFLAPSGICNSCH
jgi:hypothetical protein